MFNCTGGAVRGNILLLKRRLYRMDSLVRFNEGEERGKLP